MNTKIKYIPRDFYIELRVYKDDKIMSSTVEAYRLINLYCGECKFRMDVEQAFVKPDLTDLTDLAVTLDKEIDADDVICVKCAKRRRADVR